MFEVPSLLPYPVIRDLNECPEIHGIFCYIIDKYAPGISAVIKLDANDAGIIVGNWDGENASPKNKDEWEKVEHFLNHTAYDLIKIMRHIRLQQAEFFISDNGRLVDVQLSLNKFIGPGMLKDLFAPVVNIQNSTELAVLDPDKIAELNNGERRFILKPSKSRHYMHDNKVLPLYACI